MKQWEIWTCDFADAGPHPAIIVSHPDRVAQAPLVNVLIGSSQRANRTARENEIVLNGTSDATALSSAQTVAELQSQSPPARSKGGVAAALCHRSPKRVAFMASPLFS